MIGETATTGREILQAYKDLGERQMLVLGNPTVCIPISQIRMICDAFERLEAALVPADVMLQMAAEKLEEWGEYASDYFKEKHGLKEDIAHIRANSIEIGKMVKR